VNIPVPKPELVRRRKKVNARILKVNARVRSLILRDNSERVLPF